MPSSSSATSRHGYHQDVSNLTHCECPYPIPVQVSWTPENPGRRFKGCPIRDKRRKCNVYGFLDDELPSDYYKKLVFDLHEENKELRKNLNRTRGTPIDSNNEMVLVNQSNKQMLLLYDVKDELGCIKAKLNSNDRVMGVVCMCLMFLCVVIGYLVVA